jgi:hypothetical protein
MHSQAALLINGCLLFATMPPILFLWRRKRQPVQPVPKEVAEKDRKKAGEDWLYVGKDEDGTPCYVDMQRLSYDPASPVRVTLWAKYRPLKGSTALLHVEVFLRAAGKDLGAFDYIREHLEINYGDNMVRDLELVFHRADGKAIESVSFRNPEWKAVAPGSLQELLQKTIEGVWRPDRFHVDPQLRERIQEKLKEVNAAFEAFETASPGKSGPDSGKRA